MSNAQPTAPPPYTPNPTASTAVPPSNIPQYAPGYHPYGGPQAPVPGVYVQQYGSNIPQYGATTTVTTVQPVRQHQVNQIIIVGACPACRVGVLQDDFTCLGIFCCIFFFPLGIICCLMMKNRRCSNCGAYFG